MNSELGGIKRETKTWIQMNIIKNKHVPMTKTKKKEFIIQHGFKLND